MRATSLLFFLLLFAAVGDASASTRPYRSSTVIDPDTTGAVVSGFVRDSVTGETMVGATLRIRSLRRGAGTYKSGYYALHIPANERIEIEVSVLGYVRHVETVLLRPGQSKQLDFRLKPEDIQGGEVTVESDRDREREAPQMSTITIKPAQVSLLPKAGEADIFRVLQLLPGVQTSSEISSGLYIRGGSPDQNLILLDGSVLYNPSHFFGFFSTFNTDAIKDVELIKGGFPAQYGGRLSAVLSVTNKDGDRYNTHGKVSIGAISSRGTIETPVGSGAITLSARRTYIDVVLDALGLTKELELPSYHFYDLNGKLTQNPSESDKVSLSGYLGADDLLFTNDKAGSTIGMNWGNRSGSLEWTHIFGAELFSKFDLSVSRYASSITAGAAAEQFTWKNDLYDYSLNGGFEYGMGEEHQLKAGIQATHYDVRFKVQSGDNPPSGDVNVKPQYGAIYLQDEWKPAIGSDSSTPLAINAGLRVDGISSRSNLGIDPRVSARYIINPVVTAKASVGIYHQYMKLATNTLLPVFDVWLPVDSTQDVERAVQYVVGVSTAPMEGYQFDVEAYYKDMKNLAEMRPNIISGKSLNDVFFVGDGRAYGIEFFLQKQMGDLTGWIGYTLAWTRRTFPDINQGREFPPTYDRRNDLNVVLTYRLNDRWTIGSTFVYATGQAYSQITALAPNAESPERAIPIQGDKNALRLPPYNRLDASATYSFSLFSDKRNAELNIDIYNIYNHRNVWISQVDQSTNPATINQVKLLPILPTFGLSVTF
jgi:outer membrane receptor for ferrienterochelin and colicin